MIEHCDTVPRVYPLLFAIMILVMIMLCSCDSSTEPENTGTISGSVQLQDDAMTKAVVTDYSGVRVAVYSLAILDTTIVRINTEHPNIGLIISQETEFDHRLQSPVATSMTDASGAFSIGGLSPGAYNIAFLKDGWSIKYLYSITVTAAANTQVGNQQLKPAVSMTDTFYPSMVFEGDRTYILNNTVSIVGQTTLKKGTRVYMANNSELRLYGGVSFSGGTELGNYWLMDTGYNLYGYATMPIDSLNYAGGLILYGGNTHIEHGLIRRSNYALTTFDGRFTFENMDINNFNTGYSLNNSGGSFTRVQIRNGKTIGIQALSTVDTLKVSKCAVINSADGVVAYTSGGYSVTDSYFMENYNAVYPQNCNGVVEYNNFYLNSYDIRQYNARCNISYNNFFQSRNTTLLPRNYALIRNNNFYKTDVFFINIRGGNVNTYSIVQADLDAKENYWAVSNIDTYILDKLDNANYPGTECIFQVNYLPKKYSKVVDAGIR